MKILGARVAYQGWLKLMIADVLTPDGQTVTREFIDAGPSVSVLAYDPSRRVALMVSQFRTPVAYAGGPLSLLEAVAGRLDGDLPEECARREAMEEAGVRLGALEPVAGLWASPGPSTEYLTLFLAAYSEADKIEAGGGLASEHEHLTVVEIPLIELWRRAQAGELPDMASLCLVLTLKLRRPQLFEESPGNAMGR